MRNFVTLLFISQGVPFLLHGDEFGRTQKGNNNAYCQDNDLSWVDWELTEKNAGLLRFTKMMIALRKRHFALRREEFVNRVSWHGLNVGDPDWTGQKRILAFQLHGWHGQPHFYFIFNSHWEWQKFNLPPHDGQWRWKRLVDTNLPTPDDIVEEVDAIPLTPGGHYIAAPRSAIVLMSPV
jgi:glycogen operon protein